MDEDRRQKILIVDDERSNILALNNILKPEYTTLVAINGHAAIDIAKESMPDLILLDVIMPDMTGFEVLAELKRNALTSRIPVVIITCLDSTEDEETGFFLGAVDYITKPFHGTIVRARVKTHLKMMEYIREIERFGVTDTLTNIANRRNFDNRINIEWSRAIRDKTPLSLLMIDLDRFKDYNDTYGHTQGDKILQVVASVFTRSLSRSSDFIARWGGEEFAALLHNTDQTGALYVAERIRANVEKEPVTCASGAQTFITVSIGLCTELPTPESELKNFINKADMALYKAKNSGRNRVCISE